MRTKVKRENKSVYFYERANLFQSHLRRVFSWVLFVYLLVPCAMLMNDIDLHCIEIADAIYAFFH